LHQSTGGTAALSNVCAWRISGERRAQEIIVGRAVGWSMGHKDSEVSQRHAENGGL
jgi:hypothetical protein